MSVLLDEGFRRSLEIVSRAALVGVLVLSLVIVYRVAGDRSLPTPLRRRFVRGVPWGTAIVVVSLWLVFQFLQGGAADDGPVFISFRSWSVWYPQGILLSSFTHSGESHLLGNLFGTLAFAPIVEYAWGHYAREDERGVFPGWTGRPAVRIGLFVAVTFLAGVCSALFVPVAAVGFSAVVFAFAGAAVVLRPLVAVGAIVGIRVVRLVWEALLNPVVTFRSQPVFSSPSFVDVSIQGHLFGVLVGFLLAVFLLQYRDSSPDIRAVFFAAVVFLVTRSMDAIYWELGNGRFMLFRALGTAGVLLLASLIALSITRRNPPVIPRLDLSVRRSALAAVLVALLILSVAGLVFNLGSVTAGAEAENGLEIRDYTVTYAENVPNQYLAGAPKPLGLGPQGANVSGVIVVSEDRDAWEVVASARRLAAEGRVQVVVGGVAWRQRLFVSRTAWVFIDGNVTYNVFAFGEGQEPVELFKAPPANTSTVVDNSTFSIEPTEGFRNYTLAVERGGEQVGSALVPRVNETVDIAGFTFERKGDLLFLSQGNTSFQLARFRRSGRL
ncbi:MAG: rhomboid family intramembrane serine protease [Halovenus sp.]